MSTSSPDGSRDQAWIGSIVVRCRKFDEMLAFWQAALGYVAQAPPDDGWVILTDPTGGAARTFHSTVSRSHHRWVRSAVSISTSTPTTALVRLSAC